MADEVPAFSEDLVHFVNGITYCRLNLRPTLRVKYQGFSL